MSRRIFCKVLLVIVAVFALLVASGVLSAQGRSEDGLQRAIAAQERHTDKLMAKPGVVGTAVGLNDNGQHIVMVLLERPGVGGVPNKLDGVSVRPVVTGKIYALADPTARFPRPVPIGVSTGHPAITAGTIGCRVTDGTNVYALSNNHVYANENNATIDDAVIQPGTYDGGHSPEDDIGTLSDFEPIVFHPRANNTIDAAIALSSKANLGNATPSGGYGTPSSATASAYVGLAVQKYGRTTGLTAGVVDGINATVRVRYDSGQARFVGQIIIIPIPDGPSFSAGGDSGSLIVTNYPDDPDNDKKAVGLLFAGSSSTTVANPIGLVLSRFGVTVDSSEGPVDNPPTVTITNPSDGATVSSTVSVTADASDDNGVTQVEFFLDDSSIGVDTTAPYEISWNSTSVADGPHTIEAVATDTIGQTASDSVNVTVDNVDDPPTVSITNPTDGATVSGTVTVTADASDDKGVTQVEFFVGGVSIGVDTSGSDGWSASWDTTTYDDGSSHTVSATATDTVGQAASDSVSVTVENSGPATMHVAGIEMSLSTRRAGRNTFTSALATVTIVDVGGNPVEGATVYGSWSGATSDTDSGVTDSLGKVTLSSDGVKNASGGTTFTFTVDNVVKSGWGYDAGANAETSDSITVD